MNSWKLILAVVVVFGAGVLTGGLLVNYVHQGGVHFPPVAANPQPQIGVGDHEQMRMGTMPRLRSPEMWRKDFIERLDKTLKLTPAQHDAIQKIITDAQERNRQIWTNVAPKMRRAMEESQQQIRAELTPDQQKKFETLIKRSAPRHPPRKEAPPGTPPSTNPPPPAPDF